MTHTQAPRGAASASAHSEWLPTRYRDGVFSHALATEHERLRLLESVLDPHTKDMLSELGVGHRWRCLEVGAGAGSIAVWMARQGASVTAIDLDTTYLDRLDEPSITVRQHDLCTDDFPPGSFDLIHTRYVLTHLPDQDEAISRLAGWLAPGGILLVEEPAFFPIQNAPHPAYRTVTRAFRDYLEDTVGTRTDWARSLPTPLFGKGLTGIDMRARFQQIRGDDAESQWWRLTLEQSRPGIVSAGLAPDSLFERAYAQLSDPTFRDLSLAVFTAWGRKE
ncbi:methyltransferase family protein [Saccharopolyspora spinosa]|uniref:Methyltransferase family protein n=2 Tax=Saccharopolyspora spinosa TaxID=60894 RepID=A0A2N3Y3B0_SACSN|nr:methyltransferase family protein [Saccharopolyspora spinosa]